MLLKPSNIEKRTKLMNEILENIKIVFMLSHLFIAIMDIILKWERTFILIII